MGEPVARRPSPAKLSKMTFARNEKLLMMKAKAPTYSTFLMSEGMTERSSAIAQNSPASVMSMAIRTVVRNATSGASSPKPDSM
jgi:hypothetical protein